MPNSNALFATDLGAHIHHEGAEEYYSLQSQYSKIIAMKDQKMRNAAHWFRKGNNSIQYADKLLNYWISFEELFNFEETVYEELIYKNGKSKLDIIKNISVSVTFMNRFHQEAWNLYYHYKQEIDPVQGTRSPIPIEVLESGGIIDKTNGWVQLKPFLKILPELQKYEKNVQAAANIDRIIRLFSDCNTAKIFFKEIEKSVENDISYIYRLRNLIVHNASYQSLMLPYYTWRARSIVQITLNSIIEDLRKNEDISKLMINFSLYRDTFKHNLEKGHLDLFSD